MAEYTEFHNSICIVDIPVIRQMSFVLGTAMVDVAFCFVKLPRIIPTRI